MFRELRLHINERLDPKATTGIAEKTQTPRAFADGPHSSGLPTVVPDTPASSRALRRNANRGRFLRVGGLGVTVYAVVYV